MTNAEKYLATIDRWLYKEDDEFTKFLRSELKTVVETEELAPADETEKILNSSDVIQGLWHLVNSYDKTPVSKYTDVSCYQRF